MRQGGSRDRADMDEVAKVKSLDKHISASLRSVKGGTGSDVNSADGIIAQVHPKVLLDGSLAAQTGREEPSQIDETVGMQSLQDDDLERIGRKRHRVSGTSLKPGGIGGPLSGHKKRGAGPPPRRYGLASTRLPGKDANAINTVLTEFRLSLEREVRELFSGTEPGMMTWALVHTAVRHERRALYSECLLHRFADELKPTEQMLLIKCGCDASDSRDKALLKIGIDRISVPMLGDPDPWSVAAKLAAEQDRKDAEVRESKEESSDEEPKEETT